MEVVVILFMIGAIWGGAFALSVVGLAKSAIRFAAEIDADKDS